MRTSMWLSKYMLLQICCREKLQYLCNTKKLKRGVFCRVLAGFRQDFHPYLTDLHLINHTFCRICIFLIFFETRWLFLLLFLSHRTLRILLFFFIWHTVYIACVVLGNPCFNENHKVPCNTMHSVFFMFAPAGQTH